MKRKLLVTGYAIVFLLLIQKTITAQSALTITPEIAERLSALPLHCISSEWPNKTSHLSETPEDHVLLPHELHPAFFGCLDWHSSVHGHWMLVRLLQVVPGITNREAIIATLNNSFTEENMIGEAAYFSKYKTSGSYERTYGWAWLLKLDQELYLSNDTMLRRWHKNMQPLTRKIVDLWKAYLPKQTYPNRTGVHPNTAFGLCFALDWARAVRDTAFERLIVQRSRDYYYHNKQTPAYLEPDGTDFLSPSLEIADLMRRVLSKTAFLQWFDQFYTKEGIVNITRQPVVSDRTDYLIVHLDGLSLSRAWCMKGIAAALPATHYCKKLFRQTADVFLKKTLPNVTSGNYGGDHWLASFAVYALSL